MIMDNLLFIIPARGGSKGIPGKNIKPLCGKPLIYYTIDAARSIVDDSQICVSTDDARIVKIVEEYGLNVHFKRPEHLATDNASTYDVLRHALNYYEERGNYFDAVILLQATSPFRKGFHVEEALQLYSKEIDMVVSVTETSTNPYYNCFEEDESGFLHISKGNGDIKRRQDAPKCWEYNGAIYIINPDSLKRTTMGSFDKIRKYVMDNIHSIDLDTPLDWITAESIIEQHLL